MFNSKHISCKNLICFLTFSGKDVLPEELVVNSGYRTQNEEVNIHPKLSNTFGPGEIKVLFKRYSLYANIDEREIGISIIALKSGLKDLVPPATSETPSHISCRSRTCSSSVPVVQTLCCSSDG